MKIKLVLNKRMFGQLISSNSLLIITTVTKFYVLMARLLEDMLSQKVKKFNAK